MAFRINAHLGFGDGATGNLTAGAAQVVNNYAQIYYVSGKAVKISNVSNTGYGTFTVGQEVLVHVAGYKGSATYCKKRGFWRFCKITAVTGDVITLSKDAGLTGSQYPLDDLYMQLITVPHFKTLTLDAGKSVTCPQFSYTTGTGGVIVFKCAEELKFNGGHVDTRLKGMPDNSNWQKGRVPDEIFDSILRREGHYEHYRTLNHLTINYPDGAALILAKKITAHEDSRIGNAALSNSNSRGVVGGDSTTIFGGSSIVLVGESIENWHDKLIQLQSSYNFGQGARGVSRCYIASEPFAATEEFPANSAPFAFDVISDPTRMSRVLNIKSFGDGSLGDKTNYTKQLNSYVNVISMDKTRKVFTVGTPNESGLAKFDVGALVMIHSTPCTKYYGYTGKFMFTRIVGKGIGTITVEDAFAKTYGSAGSYAIQIIAVPQFKNFTLTGTNSATPAYDKTKKYGGILALAVSETCDISGGYLNVHSKGGAIPYGSKGLLHVSNASMAERLPIGQGHGSVFILAKNLIMTTETRIGANDLRYPSNTGTEIGGQGYQGLNRSITNYSNGNDVVNKDYQGTAGNAYKCSALTIATSSSSNVRYIGDIVGRTEYLVGTYGGITTGGKSIDGEHNGGYGSNSSDGDPQGAHIMIVAGKITGLCLHALCTGGSGGKHFSTTATVPMKYTGEQGACGYGGSGASIGIYRGGNGGILGGGGGADAGGSWASGGGSAGFCFIYCNTGVSQVTGGMFPG